MYSTNAATLLQSFFDQEGRASAITRERNLMLNEGHRVIFINFNYDATTGKLKYAASIFRRQEVTGDCAKLIQHRCDYNEEGEYVGYSFIRPDYNADGDQVGYWFGDNDEDCIDDIVVYYKNNSPSAQPYYEITEQDVANHIETTDRRFEIRPVKIVTDMGLVYDDIISVIRWEMCHGAGCKGQRNTSRASSVESDTSFLSTDSQPEMSYNLTARRTVKHIKYYTTDRDTFIAFKAVPQTGEIAYGAAIHQRSETDVGPPSSEIVNTHLGTAESRLLENPVVFTLTDEQKEFSHQLKRDAVHREDITPYILQHIFKRRGGRIQVRAY